MKASDGKKICVGCGEPKPATTEHFYRMRSASDGLQGRCQPCDNAHRGQARGKGVYDRIARALGVTPARVKQIEAGALRKLSRKKLARELAR